MKTKVFLLSIFLSSVCGISFSQTAETNLTNTENIDSAGLQINPMSDNPMGNIQGVFSERDIYMNAKLTTIGTRISGPFYYPDYPWIGSYGVSLAIYAGNSSLSEKWINGYPKLSPLNHTYNDRPLENNCSSTLMYYAPGISLYSKSRKFSFDFYRQLSSQPIISGKQQSAPFKANFHF